MSKIIAHTGHVAVENMMMAHRLIAILTQPENPLPNRGQSEVKSRLQQAVDFFDSTLKTWQEDLGNNRPNFDLAFTSLKSLKQAEDNDWVNREPIHDILRHFREQIIKLQVILKFKINAKYQTSTQFDDYSKLIEFFRQVEELEKREFQDNQEHFQGRTFVSPHEIIKPQWVITRETFARTSP